LKAGNLLREKEELTLQRSPGTLSYLAAVVLLAMYFSCAQPVHSEELSETGAFFITADAAVLMDARTGQILYEKNARQKMPPASTTKIMTALLALEGGDLQQIVTVSPNAASTGEASLDLRPGEKLTLEELIYGAMLESGNDACVAIAEHISGTEENFVLLMNQKAKMIGAEDTSFKNSNGLPAAGHCTTARDLAVITRYALRNDIFRKVVSTRGRAVGGEKCRYLSNTNRLLWSYAWADGVKTGTTGEAGNCLVASATKDGRQLISVVLHSDDRWLDSVNLMEFGFENFNLVQAIGRGEPIARVTVKEGTEKEVKAVAGAGIDAVVPKNGREQPEKAVEIKKDVIAPVQKGQYLGRVTILVKGEVIGSADLVADRSVERENALRVFLKKAGGYFK